MLSWRAVHASRKRQDLKSVALNNSRIVQVQVQVHYKVWNIQIMMYRCSQLASAVRGEQ